MSSPRNIVYQDSQITQILDFHKGAAAPALFERYRISGQNRDDFVAALIGRLCMIEARSNFALVQNTFPPAAPIMDSTKAMEMP